MDDDARYACGEQTGYAVCLVDVEDGDEALAALETQRALLQDSVQVWVRLDMVHVDEDVVHERPVDDVLRGVVATLETQNIPRVVA